MRYQNHREEHAESLRDHAAELAFPDWTPGPNDWTHLYTGFEDGSPCTEVAVYRGHDRIHYTRIRGDDLQPFWLRLVSAYAEM